MFEAGCPGPCGPSRSRSGRAQYWNAVILVQARRSLQSVLSARRRVSLRDRDSGANPAFVGRSPAFTDRRLDPHRRGQHAFRTAAGRNGSRRREEDGHGCTGFAFLEELPLQEYKRDSSSWPTPSWKTGRRRRTSCRTPGPAPGVSPERSRAARPSNPEGGKADSSEQDVVRPHARLVIRPWRGSASLPALHEPVSVRRPGIRDRRGSPGERDGGLDPFDHRLGQGAAHRAIASRRSPP